MPEFLCRVASGTGDVIERKYVAADEAALRRDLENQDLMLLDVRRSNPFLQHLARTLRIKGSVSSREFLIFNKELSALVRAGLPIVPSLTIVPTVPLGVDGFHKKGKVWPVTSVDQPTT